MGRRWGSWRLIKSKLNQTIGSVRIKIKGKENHNVPKIRSEQNLENEIVGMRIEIPQGETRNKYGESARAIGTEKIEKTESFYADSVFLEVPEG